jgi:dynein heavy chain 2
VDILSTDAAKKRTELEQANEKANATMSEIEVNMAGAAKSKEEMKALSAALSVEEKKLVVQKAKIEEQLSGIQPMVDAARAAVGNINKKSLDEIRMLKTPGMTIRDIMEGVVRLMGHADTSWNGIKSFLSRSGVINDIMSFDAGRTTGDIRIAVERLLSEKAASFEPENAKHASVAAEPLAAWVRAAVEFSRVKESIKPLEDKLAAASAKLDASRKKMLQLEEGIKRSDEEVARLKAQFQKLTQEASRLQIALEQTQQTLDQAQSLLGKLAGERDRWRQQEKEIDAELAGLPASSLLSAAFTTYLSSAPEDARAEILASWSSIVQIDAAKKAAAAAAGQKDQPAQASTSAWSYAKFMATESELLALKAEGLPADTLSVENALAVKWNPGVSFIVDPSTQATAWLLKSLKDRPFEVTTQEDEKFTNKLELSIRFGKTLVVQEVDRIHPILYPILRKDLVRQGSQLAVQVGDKPMTYSEDFRIFLVTRDPRPDLPPDARALLTEVNFTVTRSGLEGQLLMLALQHERPELEQRKAELLFKEEEDKVQMAKLEEQLLDELAKSTGNILENKSLISSLEVMKEKAGVISKSLEDSKRVQEDLDRERSVYKPIAKSGSNLFFVMQDLGKVNHMYRFSLNSFLPLFQRALAMPATPGGDVGKRIDNVREAMLRNTLTYVSRSLFKADRLMFALHLAHVMLPSLF